MTSNITAAIAALLNTAGLGYLNLARDEAVDRDTTAMPYAVMHEGISTQPARASTKDVPRLVELVQLDLFQNRAAGPDNPALMRQVRRAINASAPTALTGSDTATVYRIRPEGSVRFYDPKTRIVTESLTVRVTRTS